MPIDFMLRASWLGLSSKEKKLQRSPRAQAAAAKCAAMLVLPSPVSPYNMMVPPVTSAFCPSNRKGVFIE